MDNTSDDSLRLVDADATRALPVVRRRMPGPVRYAHSGVGPAGAPSLNGGTAGGSADVAGTDDVAGARPVLSATRVQLLERIRRAGGIRLTERIRLAGHGCPPEIAHE